MKKKDLFKQLHNLQKKIKPELDWQQANREILLAQIKAQGSSDRRGKSIITQFFASYHLQASLKSAGSLLVIVIVVLSTWITTVGASKKSLPGDLLYTFKLTSERVQVSLTFDNEKKANLEMEFAERRLQEVKDIINKNGSQSETQESIKIPLQKFQENIDNVKSNLAKLEQDNNDSAIKVAELVDAKTNGYVDLLHDQQTKTPEMVLPTDEAISASKITGDKALSLLIKEYELGKAEVPWEAINFKIQKRLTDLEAGLKQGQNNIETIMTNLAVAQKAATSAAEEAAKKAAEAAKTAAETADSQPADSDEQAENTSETIVIPAEAEVAEGLLSLADSKAKISEAFNLLAEAKVLINNNTISQGFDKIKQSDEILTLINKVISANSQYLQINEEPAAEPVTAETGENNTEAKSEESQ